MNVVTSIWWYFCLSILILQFLYLFLCFAKFVIIQAERSWTFREQGQHQRQARVDSLTQRRDISSRLLQTKHRVLVLFVSNYIKHKGPYQCSHTYSSLHCNQFPKHSIVWGFFFFICLFVQFLNAYFLLIKINLQNIESVVMQLRPQIVLGLVPHCAVFTNCLVKSGQEDKQ